MSGGEVVQGPAANRTSGSYTANLLGNIQSHLAGLHGFDVMGLELIQNADDAGAQSVVFDVTDAGLVVRNSARFTYCGDLNARPCPFRASSGYDCDYHRISDVGSAGKLLRGDNIGRFGIGFLSTYQVTDHPEIRSSGMRLTLLPASGQWTVDEPYDASDGTVLFLPWARDPDSETRLALGLSAIGPSLVDEIVDGIARVLRHSLLFLRHLRMAEVRREGELVLGCELDRGDGSELLVTFRPGGEVEQWRILRADAADAAEILYDKHPRLGPLGRSTQVAVGLRIEPQLLSEGRLYAFLPTEQPTGLPLHINADFFPESDRKHVIFAGGQHTQAWNEMLVEAAADEVARHTEGLLEMVGPVQLWQILGKAYELDANSSNLPECYGRIWERVEAAARVARIVPTHDGSIRRPDEVFLPPGTLEVDQAEALLEVGGRVVAEELGPFRNAMIQVGAPLLTLERLVGLLESTLSERVGSSRVDDERMASFHRPLWHVLDGLIPAPEQFGPGTRDAVDRLKRLPLVVTEDRFPVALDQSYAAPQGVDPGRVATRLPGLAVVSKGLVGYTRLGRLPRTLDLGELAAHLRSRLVSAKPEEVVGRDPAARRDFYDLLVDLDDPGGSDGDVYRTLCDLPIWSASRGMTAASRALLPGDFEDPLGRSDLLDTAVLSERARGFLTRKLGVMTQTIQAYVEKVLPEYFGDSGPVDAAKYGRLMTELADHSSLANDKSTRTFLGSLPLVPTRDGGWACPGDSYWRTENLARVLGEAKHLWLDGRRIPNLPSVHMFLDALGVRETASPRHLVERIIGVAGRAPPDEDGRRASGEAFYALCDNYDAWKEDAEFLEAIAELGSADCLPAEGDDERWHSPGSLHAPFRADAFRSQAAILDFRTTARLKTDLLRTIGVTIEPSTNTVVNHLRDCMGRGVGPHRLTYQVLNERAESDSTVSELAGTRCIYAEDRFVRTSQVFFERQQLGRHAFTVPESMRSFGPLFRAIGVKDGPDRADYIEILVEVTGAHFERSEPVTGAERGVYETCLAAIAGAHEREECDEADLLRLAKEPTVLNLAGVPAFPDEILLHDSEWYAGFFGDGLDRALCRLPSEHWALAEALGVRRLSESARVSLDYVGAPEHEEPELAERLAERTDIFVRLLHDQPAPVRERVRDALATIEAVSAADLRIEASVDLDRYPTSGEVRATQAFYDVGNGRLTVRRPVGRESWAHVLNAVFHQMMPSATGGEISKLTLGMRPLMEVGLREAHVELTDAGVPELAVGSVTTLDESDLVSGELGDIGAGSVAGSETETDGAERYPASGRAVSEDDAVAGEANRDETVPGEAMQEPGETRGLPDGLVKDGGEGQGRRHADGEGRGDIDGEGRIPRTPGRDAIRRKEPRPKHKRQWDRRLYSYVREKDMSQGGDGEGPLEHNLAVEAVARAAVCAYEKEMGRLPEEMSQTNPGFDIVSHDPKVGEDRRIEVKGVAGEWNQTGVGLSRLQFSNAQEEGDAYWLYVVEFVESPAHMRVHAIQNPALQVTAFMFDGNWRDVAVAEQADPTTRFVPGVRVHHEHRGPGEIREVVERGASKTLTIWYDRSQQAVRNEPLNLSLIRVVEDDDGDDGP